MHNYIAEFFFIAGLHLLAVMSPGPDFVMISRNSLIYSRKTGLISALGLALGIVVHITYCLIGIAYIISKSIVIFSTLKLLGAGYLMFIGYKALKAKPSQAGDINPEKADMGKLQALKMGFLTNLFNPKVTLFFLALFTQVISPQTPLYIKLAYGLEMSTMTFVWFGFVSLVLSHNKIQKPFLRFQHYVERVTGLALIALGLKVALSRAK